MKQPPNSLRIKMLQLNIRRLIKRLGQENEALEASDTHFQIPELPSASKAASVASSSATKKGKVAIVCWDLGHNPAGRAIVLYDLLAENWDVELIGPLWSQFGHEVWPPIAKSHRNIRTLVCDTLAEFYPAASAFAETNAYDLVIVSKPRAPALALGAMLKKNWGCPLVLDVDDLELSFASDQEPATKKDVEKDLVGAFKLPYESLAIRYCETLITEADSITVSNIALRQRYGGHMVRHARDESLFCAENFDREKARKRLGLKKEDFALVFVGTSRPHKGILTVAKALHEMDDSRFVLNIVGDIDYPEMQDELDSYDKARINYFSNCDFESLPGYLAAADAVPLLQEFDSEIAQYQIPAKISDATAFGLPVISTEVPPVYDLETQGLITVIHPDYFAETIQELYEARGSKEASAQRAQIRAGFEDELGFKVNRMRLENAIDRASDAGPSLSKGLGELLSLMEKAYLKLDRPRAIKPLPPQKGKKDLVMFWKQNDSGLYGRRSDMIMKHLIKSNQFGRILQFDAPMNLEKLAKLAEKSEGSLDASGLSATNAVRNKKHLNDTNRYFLRTFIWSDSFRKSSLIDGTSMDVYIAYIEEQMRDLGLDPQNTIAWVCPVVFEFPKIAKAIPFAGIVSDIIDDQRAFDLDPAKRRKIEQNYEEILPLSDVVITNCQPNVDAFIPLTKSIDFVPNGTEIPAQNLTMPKALENIPRPIAGYVGNLQDRIDWDLLDEVAERAPGISIVIAGGGALPGNIERLNKRSNVHFLGVVPYERVQAYIQHFDICIVPHKGTDLTRRMNPLKVYNFFAAKKPIVTTEVENIDGMMNPYIKFARNAGEFADYIKDIQNNPLVIDAQYNEVLKEITWDSRIRHIGAILDEAFDLGSAEAKAEKKTVKPKPKPKPKPKSKTKAKPKTTAKATPKKPTSTKSKKG